MKCDSRASLSTSTFASLCLGREPKARVATLMAQGMGNTQMENEMGTHNLDVAKTGLGMTLLFFFFLAFSHAFSNVIQSHQVV
jgi:hypothetical protein